MTFIMRFKTISNFFKHYVLILILLSLSITALSDSPFKKHSDYFLSKDAEIEASKPLKLMYLMKAEETGNPYWPRVREGAEQASDDFNVEVNVTVPQKEVYDIAGQVKIVNSLIDADYDGLVIIPIDTEILTVSVERLIESGKPVIVHDTPLNSTKTLTQLSFDNFQAGLKIGQWINEKLNQIGKVVILEGQSESLNAVERRNGFLAGLSNGEIEVMDIRSANWIRSEAKNIVKEWLVTFPDVNAILAASDSMALGAMEAVEELHREDILITGIDASQETLKAIEAGKIHATVDQSPEEQARTAVQLMIRHIERGETFPELSTWRKSPLITIENANQFIK